MPIRRESHSSLKVMDKLLRNFFGRIREISISSGSFGKKSQCQQFCGITSFITHSSALKPKSIFHQLHFYYEFMNIPFRKQSLWSLNKIEYRHREIHTEFISAPLYEQCACRTVMVILIHWLGESTILWTIWTDYGIK